jgi:hypothetical protein
MTNMKRKLLLITIAVVAVILSGVLGYRAGAASGASNGSPGSVGDPLVTKSYVDGAIAGISSDNYKKVVVGAGKTVALSMSAQFIFYGGTAKVSGGSGIINLSAGQLFKSGDNIVLYSHYFVSDAASAVKCSNECVFYICGGYTVK